MRVRFWGSLTMAGRPGLKHSVPRRPDRRRRRPWRRYLLIPPVLVVCLLGVSLAGAAMTPGNQNLEAKWADWLRSHHAGFVAQHMEEIYYPLTAPSKGGQPHALN